MNLRWYRCDIVHDFIYHLLLFCVYLYFVSLSVKSRLGTYWMQVMLIFPIMAHCSRLAGN